MMRGLQTTVKDIRRRVFTEVAKLGFKADAETLLDDMEAIPYEIVNDDTQKYRESTYRSRAIVRERLRAPPGNGPVPPSGEQAGPSDRGRGGEQYFREIL